ncbi:hypothetical protein EJB05_57264, partial [Eragrostis curvula]
HTRTLKREQPNPAKVYGPAHVVWVSDKGVLEIVFGALSALSLPGGLSMIAAWIDWWCLASDM